MRITFASAALAAILGLTSAINVSPTSTSMSNSDVPSILAQTSAQSLDFASAFEEESGAIQQLGQVNTQVTVYPWGVEHLSLTQEQDKSDALGALRLAIKSLTDSLTGNIRIQKKAAADSRDKRGKYADQRQNKLTKTFSDLEKALLLFQPEQGMLEYLNWTKSVDSLTYTDNSYLIEMRETFVKHYWQHPLLQDDVSGVSGDTRKRLEDAGEAFPQNEVSQDKLYMLYQQAMLAQDLLKMKDQKKAGGIKMKVQPSHDDVKAAIGLINSLRSQENKKILISGSVASLEYCIQFEGDRVVILQRFNHRQYAVLPANNDVRRCTQFVAHQDPINVWNPDKEPITLTPIALE